MNLLDRQPELHDGTIVLRAWRPNDLDCIAEASAEGRIPEGTTVPTVFSERAARAFVERQHARAADGQGWSLAIATASDDLARGCIVLLLRPEAGVAGIGYWLAPSARGLGYASRAVTLLTDWGLTDGRLARVEAWVEPDNDTSSRLLRGCGYRLEGRLRSFLAFPSRRADALVFSRVTADLIDGILDAVR